jgi:hypothetical protein
MSCISALFSNNMLCYFICNKNDFIDITFMYNYFISVKEVFNYKWRVLFFALNRVVPLTSFNLELIFQTMSLVDSWLGPLAWDQPITSLLTSQDNTNTEETWTCIHALSGITHNHSAQTVEHSMGLTLLSHCDWQWRSIIDVNPFHNIS